MSTQPANVKNEEAQPAGGSPSPVAAAGGRIAELPRAAWAWLVETWQGFRVFLHEVRVEMKQVTWPTRLDVYSTTTVVIVTVFFFGLFLFLVDLGVSHVVERVFKIFKF